MKKALKITGKILLAVLILFVLFLTVIKIWDEIARSNEKELLKDHPGQSVEVDGRFMNIYTEGSGGHTIVLMSGWKVPSPIYDLKPLYTKLSDENRIAVIEKFGYGFSDETDTDRSLDTILRQDREALEKAGIEAPYVLCAHSMSGLEAALWAQKYPDEVEAIIGLDMSMAGAFDPAEAAKEFPAKIRMDKIGAFLGINRLLMNISGFEGLSDEEIRLYKAVGCSNIGNETASRESEYIPEGIKEIEAAPLPSVPTIQYVSGVNRDNGMWVNAHKEFVEASVNGRFVQLDCGHYVHHYEPERIAADIKELIAELDGQSGETNEEGT